MRAEIMLPEMLLHSSARWPEKTAVICGRDRVTYADIASRATGLAAALIEHGVRAGDRIGICLPNSIESVIAIFGVSMAGAVFVPVSSTTGTEKLAEILRNCSARCLITSARHECAANAVPSMETLICTGSESGNALMHRRMERFFGGVPSSAAGVRDLACLIYTSGSTGEPKGVMCDHGSISFASAAIIEYLGICQSDITLSALPLSFSYGLYQLLTVIRTGGTLVLEPGFLFPASIVELMERERVTMFPGVPTMHALLLRQEISQSRLPSLRCMTNAAAAVSLQTIRGIRRALPRVRFYSMYGQTETVRSLYLPPELLDQKPDSVGIPIPGTQAWVETEDGRHAEPGRVGELVVSGRNVMRGYWNDPRLTAARFAIGRRAGERFFRTGDLFRTDADGHFYFVARMDEIIKSRGEKVAPKVVEDALAEIPGVIEAAVIGIPDPVLGEAVKAVIATDGRPLSTTQVIAHCRARLDAALVPQHVEFCATLPKTPGGKIKKKDLRCAALPEFAT